MDSQLQNSFGDTPTYYPRPGEKDLSGGPVPSSRRGRGRGAFRGARPRDSGLAVLTVYTGISVSVVALFLGFHHLQFLQYAYTEMEDCEIWSHA